MYHPTSSFSIFVSILAFAITKPVIEPSVLTYLSRGPANIFISMQQGTEKVLAEVATRARAGHFVDAVDKRTALYSALRRNADESQAQILELLQKELNLTSHQTHSFWITNQIFIPAADQRVLNILRDREDVSRISTDEAVKMSGAGVAVPKSVTREPREVGYNLATIRVPEVWAEGVNGTGVVVGAISTGARHTHEVLRANYKNDGYSWFDATRLPAPGAPTPSDDLTYGYGTLHMGAMAGGLDTGVAFGAEWIVCKAAGDDGGATQFILWCAEFMVCPTKPNGEEPDCTKTPRVVHNPWYALGAWPEYESMVRGWHAAGIISVFSADPDPDKGPGCSSLAFPAWLDVIAVAATDSEDRCGEWNGQGPNPADGGLKPDMVAPGIEVTSSISTADNAYAVIPIVESNGAAAAHVAGVIALLLSVDKTLSFDQVKEILQTTAAKSLGFTGDICNELPDDVFPNYHFGHGRLDALAAYHCVRDGLQCIREAPTTGPVDETTNWSASADDGMAIWAIILIAMSAVLVAAVLILFVLWKMRRAKQPIVVPADVNKVRNLKSADEEHQENEPGLSNILFQFEFGAHPLEMQLRAQQDSVAEAQGNYLALAAPYDSEQYEIAIESVSINDGKVLGTGEFGIVYAGQLHGQSVAVKKLKPSSIMNKKCVSSLLKELKIMIYAGRHPNIVGLIGACTKSESWNNICIVLELCVNGNLERYLRACRKFCIGQSTGDGIQSLVSLADGQTNGPDAVDVNRLFQWSANIASGMEFLAQRNIIHGDLACRNVLLTNNLVAKVSDFGLASRIYEYTTKYVTDEMRPLPWRWMAIESLRDTRFSHASDVWSYGITVWEIFSLAETPYPTTVWSADFMKRLEDGLRNERPLFATDEVYALLRQCWMEDPGSRPIMKQIRETVSRIHG